MTLGDHLRELRSRLLKSIAAIFVGAILGLVFYEPIFAFFSQPFNEIAADQGLDATINFDSVLDPFIVPLKLALLTGIVVGCPVWIYQTWAFVTPALYRNERRWATYVVASSVPLFLSGIALCYWLLPKGLAVLLGFTPDNVANFVKFGEYLNFVIRLVLVFGFSFLLPVFIVLLNAAGVLSRDALANARRWVIVGIFVFAAVATPTGDPITMSLLALPMWLLFEGAIVICRFNDRRRARRLGFDPNLSDDEISPIDLSTMDSDDERASDIDDDDDEFIALPPPVEDDPSPEDPSSPEAGPRRTDDIT